MIDQIADHPQVEDGQEAEELAADIVEHEVPRLDWFECPMMSRGNMLAVIERQKDLDGRAVNLFKNALVREPRSDLVVSWLSKNRQFRVVRCGNRPLAESADADSLRGTAEDAPRGCGLQR